MRKPTTRMRAALPKGPFGCLHCHQIIPTERAANDLRMLLREMKLEGRAYVGTLYHGPRRDYMEALERAGLAEATRPGEYRLTPAARALEEEEDRG